ncbi:hypothetical protein BGZ72_009934 [Mortierella alpina]|nr:hypothetical protein BGZ72_009934 [Mortierella alpina]
MIDSITLTFHCKGTPPPFSEIISNESLRSIVAASAGSDITVLRRVAPYAVVGAEPPNDKDVNEECTVAMEIRSRLSAHTAQGVGFVKLHFMEFQLQGYMSPPELPSPRLVP